MSHRSIRSGAVAALALVLGAAPSVANAEPGIFTGTACVGPGTVVRDAWGCMPVGDPCSSDPPATCRQLGAFVTLCVPDAVSLLCCGGPADCFHHTDGGVTTGDTCVFGTGLTGGQGLCLDPSNDYCASPPTGYAIRACHSGSSTWVRYEEGDCDGDGVSNGAEMDLGTDPCAGPAPRAVWNGSDCVPVPVGCVLGNLCRTARGVDGICELTDEGTRCSPPSRSALYCGDDPYECPSGEFAVPDPARTHSWCIPDTCTDRMGTPLLGCAISPAGLAVAWPDGDCDEDGIPNGSETPAGLCVAETEPDPDAGTDAGPDPGTDAEADPDAGTSPTDAGPPIIDPRFEGGGGCACRASAPSPRSCGWLAALAIAGMLRLRRRR